MFVGLYLKLTKDLYLKKMTDKEVIKKAIGIAQDNDKNYYNECANITLNALLPVATELEFRGIIFSHNFAKAFWGEEKHLENQFDIIDNCACGELTYHYYQTHEDGMVRNCTEYCWQYHLQQMVLEQNPIDYLRKFIES